MSNMQCIRNWLHIIGRNSSSWKNMMGWGLCMVQVVGEEKRRREKDHSCARYMLPLFYECSHKHLEHFYSLHLYHKEADNSSMGSSTTTHTYIYCYSRENDHLNLADLWGNQNGTETFSLGTKTNLCGFIFPLSAMSSSPFEMLQCCADTAAAHP